MCDDGQAPCASTVETAGRRRGPSKENLSRTKISRTKKNSLRMKKLSRKKEGKRPGLNQYHFPGCVLEVFD